MKDQVVKEFLEAEGDAYVRAKLAEALSSKKPVIRELNFNVYDVTINHEQDIVTVSHIVDGDGETMLSIGDFLEIFMVEKDK